ncbi:DUF4440 domain-containing protein [Geothrix sp.]|jgi:ketosteroid isomerase-like protein|uniref:YybH family protein n=1 Tax=Geothrix sp. TaxID=1962974 RepID=UPI0025B8582B|nr:DUF4440 domain-containing protein [Geothrix sp.]
MRSSLAAALFPLVSLPSSAQGLPPPVQTQPHNQGFVQISKQWLAAYNDGDTKLLGRLYAIDAQYISGHVPGLVAIGREKVISYFQAGIQLGGHIDSLTVLSVSESCNLATVLCEYRANNAGQKANGKSLLLFRKEGDHWLIYLHMTVV